MSDRDHISERELEAAQAALHDDAGVDLSQIDMMLAISPAERLATMYETARSLARLMPDADPDTLV